MTLKKAGQMRTKDILEQSGIDRETLRFYENKGLLPKASRTDSGYRIYSDKTLSRLSFILTAKNAGFTLKEIKDLVELKQNGATCKIGRDLAVQKREELKAKMKSLIAMKNILNSFIEACEADGELGLKKKCHLSFDNMTNN